MAKKKISDETIALEKENPKGKLTCGIIMSISSIDNCSIEHWKEVQDILKDAISSAGFIARLVSEADDSGIIQKRIIQNLYSDPIVVCDVSGKNPNVMFELGMRLAFDKPTIVVKDDKTDYSFDTSPIEHIPYPRDLRFSSIIKFKDALTDKVKGTYKRANEDRDYTTFLKHFGKFRVAELEEHILGKDDYILKSIEDLRDEIRRIPMKTKMIRELPFDIGDDESYFLVKSKMIKYFKERNISMRGMGKNDLETLKKDLFAYLETFDDIRDACESPTRLERTIDILLQNV